MTPEQAFEKWWDARTAYEPQDKSRMQDAWLASAKAERERIHETLSSRERQLDFEHDPYDRWGGNSKGHLDECHDIARWISRGAPDEPGFGGE